MSKSASQGSTGQIQIRAAKLFSESDYVALGEYLDLHGTWSTDTYKAFMNIDKAVLDEERVRIAQKSFDLVFENRAVGPAHEILALEVFLFAGDVKSLVTNAKRIQSKSPAFYWHTYTSTLQLFEAPTPENIRQYVEKAAPFCEESSYANYVAGLIYFANNEREMAKTHFNRSIEIGKFDWWSHVWATAFLLRMNEDDSWPKWISNRQYDEAEMILR